MSSIKKKIASGIFVTFSGNSLTFVIRFFAGVALARILMPSDFGTVIFLTSIIGLLMMLRGFMLESYVVQCDEENYDGYVGTAFSLGILLNLGVVLIAVPIGHIFVDPTSHLMFFVLLSGEFFSQITFVFRSLIQKELLYTKVALLQALPMIISVSVGVVMALNGFGLWSLVFLNVSERLSLTILSVVFSPYYIKPSFDRKAFSHVISYGKYGFLSNVTGRAVDFIDNIIIKKMSGATSLGFYNRAFGLSKIFDLFVSSVFLTVAKPIFSKFKQDRVRLSRSYNDFMACSFRMNMFFGIVVSCVAYDFIRLVYTEKWLPSVPIMRVLMILTILRPTLSLTRHMFLHTGSSRKAAISQLILFATVIILIFPMAKVYGAMGVAGAVVIGFTIALVATLAFARSIIDVELSKIMLKPFLAGTIVVGFYMFLLSNTLVDHGWLRLITHSLTLSIMFTVLLFVIDNKYCRYLFNEIRPLQLQRQIVR